MGRQRDSRVTAGEGEQGWRWRVGWAHLNNMSELYLVENKGDEVSTADSPSDHQLPAEVQDSHLQQHPRDLRREGEHDIKWTGMITSKVHSPRHERQQKGGIEGQT